MVWFCGRQRSMPWSRGMQATKGCLVKGRREDGEPREAYRSSWRHESSSRVVVCVEEQSKFGSCVTSIFTESTDIFNTSIPLSIVTIASRSTRTLLGLRRMLSRSTDHGHRSQTSGSGGSTFPSTPPDIAFFHRSPADYGHETITRPSGAPSEAA